MAVSTNDLKNGMVTWTSQGSLFSVVEFQHVKPGKGGAFVRTKLKNVRSGAVIERTYRADEKLEQAIIDKRDMQFLYRDGTDYFVFMDTESYDQLQVPRRAPQYLKEGDAANVRCTTTRSSAWNWSSPAAVELTQAETDPACRVTASRVRASPPPCRPDTWCRSIFVNIRGRDQGRHPLRRVYLTRA